MGRKGVARAKGRPTTHLGVVGQTFGRLTICVEDGRWVLGYCSCGALWAGLRYRVIQGVSTSCGCYRRDRIPYNKGKGQYLGHPKIYRTWNNMKSRCYRDSPVNHRYKEAGIVVCERWLNGADGLSGYKTFSKDMGDPPSDKHTLERINNNGNYEPSNCRWADRKVQGNNTIRNRWIDFNGERKTMAQWGEATGLGAQNIENRLKMKWSIERALTTPVRRW